MNIHAVVRRPIITEKSMNEAAKNKFTFEVPKDADKRTIRGAVEEKFGVTVLSVTTSIVKGRRMRTGSRRIERKKPAWKKAVVTVKEGQKITLFDVGQQK